MGEINAIIFDLYGVLGQNGWQGFKEKHFGQRPQAWERLRRLGQQADAGAASQETFVAALVGATGETEATIRRQFEQTRPNLQLLDFIAQELKPAYKIGLLSNTSHDVFQSIFSAEQYALFDAAIGSFAVGLTKPDPAMFALMCRELAVEPEACVMVDDKSTHLLAAETMGMRGILYQTAEQTIRDLRGMLADD
ncbi:MAG: HAD-IA family hydrolase [Candidatus Saccharimonadales bacterium]|nr:HAD-IA family hydrolase [Candidatus Saccharibacteria bacterium]